MSQNAPKPDALEVLAESIDAAAEDLAINGPVRAAEVRQALHDLEMEWDR